MPLRHSHTRLALALIASAVGSLFVGDVALAFRPVFSTSLVAVDRYPYRVTTFDWSDYTSRFTDGFDSESFVNGSVAAALGARSEVTATVGWADFSDREFFATIPEYRGPTPWRETSAEVLTFGAGFRHFPVGDQAAFVRPFIEGSIIAVHSRFIESQGAGGSSTFVDSFTRWAPGYAVGGGLAIRPLGWLRVDAGAGYVHSGDLGRIALGTYREADYQGLDSVTWTARVALIK